MSLTSDLDWQFETPPQPHLDGRVMFLPRGKVLGGCSSINAMVYVRGHAGVARRARLSARRRPADSTHCSVACTENYDGWARSGCTGWSYRDMLPYFNKLEDCRVPGVDMSLRGTGGAVSVTLPSMVNDTTRMFLAACEEVGIPNLADYNGAEQRGAGVLQASIEHGRRHSTAAAYLPPPSRTLGLFPDRHRHSDRLTVSCLSYVTKVIIEDRRAVGVMCVTAAGCERDFYLPAVATS